MKETIESLQTVVIPKFESKLYSGYICKDLQTVTMPKLFIEVKDVL